MQLMLQGLIGLDMSFRITPSQTSTPSWPKPKTCRIHPNLVLVLPPSLVTCGRWESKTKRRKKNNNKKTFVLSNVLWMDLTNEESARMFGTACKTWEDMLKLPRNEWRMEGVPCIMHYGKRLPWYVPVLLSQPSLPWRQMKVCREAGPQ